MTRFNQCPNCGKRPTPGLLGSTSTDVYECRECETRFCYANCGNRCPNCGSKDKRKIGTCSSR